MAEQRLDKAKINDELEQLQLEETRERVAQIRRIRAMRENRMRTRQLALAKNNAIQKAAEENCAHRKGGKGKEMWFSGNDSNFAVVKHILSHGPMIVLCQRCNKVWEPPPTALRNGDTEEKREYKRLYIEYQKAVNYPTDNETSGARLFEFTSDRAA